MAENTCDVGNNSLVLNTLFGEQPSFKHYAFQDQCRKILEKYTPSTTYSPEVLAAFQNIGVISNTLLSCAIQTHADLSHLNTYIQECHETHLSNYSIAASVCNKSQSSFINDKMCG